MVTDTRSQDTSVVDAFVLDGSVEDSVGIDGLQDALEDGVASDLMQDASSPDIEDVWAPDVQADSSDVPPELDILEDSSVPDSVADVEEDTTDAGPDPMQPWAVIASQEPSPEWSMTNLVEGTYTAAYSLPIGTWVEGANGSQFYDPVNGSLLAVSGLEGSVQKVEVIGLETVLVLTTEGLYAFNGDIAAPSPLNAAVSDPPVLNLVDASTKGSMEVWLVTSSTLYLWKAGQLTAITIPGANLSGAHMTYGALFEGEQACWISTSDDKLFAAVSSDEGIEAWEVLSNAPIDALASDLDGNLWALQQGDLFRRSPDAQWDWFVFETPLSDLAAHRASWMAWFRLEGALWGHYGGEFWLLQEGMEFAAMVAGTKESLTVVQADGVAQLAVTSLPEPPVPLTTWENDVAELSEQKCGLCHGVGQFAHEMASLQQWVDEFPDIISMVETGQMPLAPVSPMTPVEIQTLLDWQSGGFQP